MWQKSFLDTTPQGTQSSFSSSSDVYHKATVNKRTVKIQQKTNPLQDIIKEFQGIKLENQQDKVGWHILSKSILNPDHPKLQIMTNFTKKPGLTLENITQYKIFCKPSQLYESRSKSTQHRLKFPDEYNNKVFFRRKFVAVFQKPSEDYNKAIRRKSCFGQIFGNRSTKEDLTYQETSIMNSSEKRKHSKILQIPHIVLLPSKRNLSFRGKSPEIEIISPSPQGSPQVKFLTPNLLTVRSVNKSNIQILPQRVERSKQLRNIKKLINFVSNLVKTPENISTPNIFNQTTVHRKSLRALLHLTLKCNEPIKNFKTQTDSESQLRSPDSSQKATLRNLFSTSKMTIGPVTNIRKISIETPIDQFTNQLTQTLDQLQKKSPLIRMKSFPSFPTKQFYLPQLQYEPLNKINKKIILTNKKITQSTQEEPSEKMHTMESLPEKTPHRMLSGHMNSSCFKVENDRLRNIIKQSSRIS